MSQCNRRDQFTAFIPLFLSSSYNFQLLPSSHTMSNVEWDSKTVIGKIQKKILIEEAAAAAVKEKV